VIPAPEAFRLISLRKARLIDVRAPIEYAENSFFGSLNLPILDDRERALVGTCYKQHGPEAAIALGLELVSGDLKAARVQAWRSAVESSQKQGLCTILSCFRGGQRSAYAQSWLRQTGIELDRVQGGTKALRAVALGILSKAGNWPLVVVAGKTGSGKTDLLRSREDISIDLEALANHRGSAFGGDRGPQPLQARFENTIAQRYLQLHSDVILIEDESPTIGACSLPVSLRSAMADAPWIEIDEPTSDRVQRIESEYVASPASIEGQNHVEARLLSQAERLTARLGRARTQEITACIRQAFAGQRAHADWIQPLLEWYYDPIYQKGIDRRLRLPSGALRPILRTSLREAKEISANELLSLRRVASLQ
jgi:tRNA 2-selenouridine synthase